MSKPFTPPAIDMGPDFQQAGSMKAKNKSKGQGTPVTSASKRRLISRKAQVDTIPVTLQNLALYMDWRRGQFEQSPTLYKFASIIWLYLEHTPMAEYSINFKLATENSITENTIPIMTTSPKGDLLVLLTNDKKLPDYDEQQFLLILFPYISDIKFIEETTVTTAGGDYCTYWEIDNCEHVTHIAMDKFGVIYFTTGETVFRIHKTEGDMYLDTFQDIFSPSNDTAAITCLWRQGNEIFLTIQDWDNEENLDVYKVKPPKDRGVTTPDSPTGRSPRGGRSPSFGRKRTRSRSGSGYGSGGDFGGGSPRGKGTANDSNEWVNKVRTFSLSFNQRIWQLGSMNFQKKFLLSVGACQQGSIPQLLQIGFKKKIKLFGLNGQGKGSKSIVWPKSVPDTLPHSIYQHKPTKSWFCILPVSNTKDKNNGLYWVQFKMDKAKKKITWQRLVPIPDEATEGDWLYFDELRDLLVGFSRCDSEEQEYVFKYLPDMSKHFHIEGSNKNDEDDLKSNKSENGPIMQRSQLVRSSKTVLPRGRTSLKNRRSSQGKHKTTNSKSTPSLRTVTSNEPNIKPSKAKKASNVTEPRKSAKAKKKKEPKKKVVKKKHNSVGKKDKAKVKKIPKKTKKEIGKKLAKVIKTVKPLKIKKQNSKTKDKSPMKTGSKSPKKTGSNSPRKHKKSNFVSDYDEEDVMD